MRKNRHELTKRQQSELSESEFIQPEQIVRFFHAVNPGDLIASMGSMKSYYDLIVCGKDGRVNMIEAKAYQIPEAVIAAALAKASTEITKLENWQKEIVKEIGKTKREVSIPEISGDAKALFDEKIAPSLLTSVMTNTAGKDSMESLKKVWKESLKECNFHQPLKNQPNNKKQNYHQVISINLLEHNRVFYYHNVLALIGRLLILLHHKCD
jgi:polyribonucleotide nucleotidyltransferase